MNADLHRELVTAFELRVRSGQETFSLLMCDVDTADKQQISLLSTLLLENGHRAPQQWLDYVQHVRQLFPARKFLLKRLVRKALQLVDEEQHRHTRSFTALHLILSELCDDEEAVSYIEETMVRHGIGLRSAELYLRWASLEHSDQTAVTRILQKGLDSLAEPRHELVSQLQSITGCAGPPKNKETLPSEQFKSSSAAAAAKSVLKRAQQGDETASRIGKCQRVKVADATVTVSTELIISKMTESSPSDADDGTVSFSLEALLCASRISAPAETTRFTSLSAIDERAESTKSSHDSKSQREEVKQASLEEALSSSLSSSATSRDSTSQHDNDHDLSVCPTVRLPQDLLDGYKQEVAKVISRKAHSPDISINKDDCANTATRVAAADELSSTVGDFGAFLRERDRIVTVNSNKYMKLGLLGKGGSTSVYRVMSKQGDLFAYKRVTVSGVDEDCRALCQSYSNEIALLSKLKGSPHIINLVDSEVNFEACTVTMVMEMGDADLSKVMADNSHRRSPLFVRHVWHQMLLAVQFIHKERIVHSDLKPANFVFVRGQLKLIDFGISKAISNDTTSIYRENQVGTINYMAPEAIIPMDYPEGEGSKAKMKLGRASDVWALGVILYQLIYCELPFGKLSTIQKLHAIPNPLHVIDFPPHNDVAAVESIRVCLVRDPLKRACIEGEFGLLNMRFLGM